MLRIEDIVKLPKHEIFASGTALDNEQGLFMSNSGKELRWVAVMGEIGDWCIYCHFAHYPLDYIKRCGDKVREERNIKLCVPCDDAAFKRYRY